ncbi:hypothetical protein HYV87_02700 [Candidatus Woesearchaeota archaeon]|nr:hypothetical protein [Candidatus Woesearchaeota archaeon]
MDDSEFCLNHNPLARELKIAAVKKGGNAPKKRRGINLPAIPIQDKQDVIPFIVQTINEVRTGRINHKIANTLVYAGLALIKAHELVDMEKRLSQIETLVLERKTYR